jgi:NRAMP (natural resistance-associated macrophage protein)-like metal ion transporter
MADPEQRQQSADPPQPIPPGREEPSGRGGRAISGGGRPGWRYVVGVLGPGLVTGAADDDPSGIATYSQTGAQFGYGQLWTCLWMLPLMTGVQEACGRIGNITGKGLARNIKDHYSLRTLRLLVLLLAAANLINIGADIGALGASAALIIHVPASVLMVIFTAVILTLEIVVSYRSYAKVLKWLTVSLMAYPVTAFFVPEPWLRILRATFVPHFQFSASFFYVITAVLGTTITPYMFFWQTSQEVEENKGRAPRRPLRDLRADNTIGMFISQLVAWFIIVTTATVLHSAHVTTISTAADAAKALQPLVRTFPHSGEIAQCLFALGIVSLGMLAIPVLAGSTSYALAETRGKREGLDLTPREGRYFYGIIAASMLIGLCLNLIGVNPIQALVFAAVFNGITAVPLIWFINRIAARPDTMGQARSGWLSRTVLALTFLGMAGSVLAMLASYLRG